MKFCCYECFWLLPTISKALCTNFPHFVLFSYSIHSAHVHTWTQSNFHKCHNWHVKFHFIAFYLMVMMIMILVPMLTLMFLPMQNKIISNRYNIFCTQHIYQMHYPQIFLYPSNANVIVIKKIAILLVVWLFIQFEHWICVISTILGFSVCLPRICEDMQNKWGNNWLTTKQINFVFRFLLFFDDKFIFLFRLVSFSGWFVNLFWELIFKLILFAIVILVLSFVCILSIYAV